MNSLIVFPIIAIQIISATQWNGSKARKWANIFPIPTRKFTTTTNNPHDLFTKKSLNTTLNIPNENNNQTELIPDMIPVSNDFSERKLPVYYEEYSVPGQALLPEPQLYVSSQHETVSNHDNVDHLYIPQHELYAEENITPDPNILPNPDLFKHELSKPKTAPPFSLRPIDPQYFQKLKQSKDPATLPNKMMAMQELITALTSVKKSVNKLNPIGKQMADMYKNFVSKVKAGIKSKKGPYAYHYPPGDYDEQYDGEEVDHRSSASEINATFVEPPDNYTANSKPKFGDHFNDHNDDYVKKSFGYRVTIYKSPESLNPNITEELVPDDEENSDNDYEDLESDASDESPVTDTKSQLLSKQTHDKDIMGEKHGHVKGRGKILDHNKNKLEKDRASKAREQKSALKLNKVDTHKRRASNERALKERTTIEFFEREQITDTHNHHNEEMFGKDMRALETESNDTVAIVAHPNDDAVNERQVLEVHENKTHENDENSYRSEPSNQQKFTMKFPIAKSAQKDNAHKLKGWRERGYKIITETEFVDRGNKLDTGFKKQEKGNVAHIKEHNAKDLTRGERAKYYKNVKELNKSYDTQYGNRLKQNDFKGYNKEEELPKHSALQSSPRDKYAKISIVSHDVNKNTAPYGYRLSSITSEQYPYPTSDIDAELTENVENEQTNTDSEVPEHSTSYELTPALPTTSSDTASSAEPTADNALTLKATSAYEPTYNLLAPNPTSSSSDLSSQSISSEPELSSSYYYNGNQNKHDTHNEESTARYDRNKDNDYYDSGDSSLFRAENDDNKVIANERNNFDSDPHLDSSNDRNSEPITYHKQIDHSYYKAGSDEQRDHRDNHDVTNYTLSNPNQLNDASNYENVDNKPEDNYRHYDSGNDERSTANANDNAMPPTYSSDSIESKNNNNNDKNVKYYSVSQYLNDQNPQFFNVTSSVNAIKPTEYIVKPSYYYQNHYNDSYGRSRENNPEYSTPKFISSTVDTHLSNEMQITTNPNYDYSALFNKNPYYATEFYNKPAPTMTAAKDKTETTHIESPFSYNNDLQNIHNIYNQAIHLQEAPNLSTQAFASMPATNPSAILNANGNYMNAPVINTASTMNVDLGSNRNNRDLNISNKKTRIKLRYKNSNKNNGFSPNYRLTPASPLTIPPLMTANDNLYLAANIPQQFFHSYASHSPVHYDIRIPYSLPVPQTTTRLPLFVQTNAPAFLYGHQVMPFSASDARPVAVLHPNKQFVSITTPAMLKSRAHHMPGNMWTNGINPLLRKLSPVRWRLSSDTIGNPISGFGFSKKHSVPTTNDKMINEFALPKIIKDKLANRNADNNSNKNKEEKGILRNLFAFR